MSFKVNEYNKGVREIHYDMTMACNNRCPYCHVLDQLDNAEKFSDKVFEKVIKDVNDYIEKNPDLKFRLFLKGGEPFLVAPKIKEYYDRITKFDMFSVFSNLNFPEKFFNRRIKYLTPDMNILCSWHPSSDDANVSRNILKLKEEGIPVEVMLLVSEETKQDVIQKWKWCRENEIRYTIQLIEEEDQYTAEVDDSVKEMFETAIDNGRKYSEKNILDSYDRFVRCELFSCTIGYNGLIRSTCDYRVTSLDDMQMVVCHNKKCRCNYDNFKEVIREKKS